MIIHGYPNATGRAYCRACDSADLVEVLDLGAQPLANSLLREDQLDEPETRYNLRMVRCRQCGLCQLDTVVNPEVLYRDYKYASGHAQGWQDHCKALASEIPPDSHVLDIAANDGTLLRHCLRRGCHVTGVDPAGALAVGADLPIVEAFWSLDLAKELGTFDVITAQNVFGHVDDARGFLAAIAQALAVDGVAIIECPWVVDLIKHRRWDTIYHEHVSYWGILPLLAAANPLGLDVVDARYLPDLHGGTLRYYVKKATPLGNGAFVCERKNIVLDFEKQEATLTDLDYERFRDSVQCEIQWWQDYFENINGKVIAGYGASAKSSTFLNALSPRPPLVGIFDDSLLKHNLYTPGPHYPILKPTKVLREVDELICFAPNWQQEVQAKAEALGFTGQIRSIWRA